MLNSLTIAGCPISRDPVRALLPQLRVLDGRKLPNVSGRMTPAVAAATTEAGMQKRPRPAEHAVAGPAAGTTQQNPEGAKRQHAGPEPVSDRERQQQPQCKEAGRKQRKRQKLQEEEPAAPESKVAAAAAKKERRRSSKQAGDADEAAEAQQQTGTSSGAAAPVGPDSTAAPGNASRSLANNKHRKQQEQELRVPEFLDKVITGR